MFLLLALIALIWFLADPWGFFGTLFCAACVAFAAFVTVAVALGAWVVLS